MLHDFHDEQCVSILSACRARVSRGGAVLVADRILPSGKDGPHPNLTMDVQMMVLLSGRERSNAEWSEIFGRARLRVAGVHDTAVDFSIVEGVPD